MSWQWGKHMPRNLNRNEELWKDCQGENGARQGCGIELRLYMCFCVLHERVQACSRKKEEAGKED